MKRLSVVFIIFIVLVGCTTTLPPKIEISKSYSLLGVKSYSLTLNSNGVNLDPSFSAAFLASYCQALDGNIRLALQRESPEFQYAGAGSDLNIEVSLEALRGGNAAARFWVGFGAGRSVSSVYVRVLKKQEILSEGRITETTTLPNFATNNFSNEDAIMQDAPLLARSIATFIKDPVKYENGFKPNPKQ